MSPVASPRGCKMRVLIGILSGICFLVATADAWNKPGHMTSAAIAYFDLKKRNPDALARAVGILEKHPQYESKWFPLLSRVSDSDRDLYLFMLAARWSDDVRKKFPEYDRPKWHSVKIPYHPGQDKVTLPEGEDIIAAFEENRSTVAKSGNDEARAVALCWMFHLIGDIHQPLHTTKLVTAQFPEPDGDPGGSRSYIRVTPDSKPISLHKFWDGLIISSDKFQAVHKEALTLIKRPELKRAALKKQLAADRSFNQWAIESYNLARKKVYQAGILKVSDSEEDGAILPHDYTKKAKEIAEKQIVLAGYRISDALTAILGH
jgi:hypothetical protein